MKFIKIPLKFILLILLNNYILCQWIQQNSNTNINFYSLWNDGFNALACGSDGKIFKTTNGGLNWINIYSASSNATVYNSICVNGATYIAGGDPNQGLIMKSSDLGNTWIYQQSNTIYTLNCIFFTNSLIGWSCGDYSTIIKTTNGGLNWISIGGGADYNNSIYFIDSINGYTGGDLSLLFMSTNSGINWFNTYFHTPGNSTINSIIFFSITTGYLSTSSAYGGQNPNGVYKTTNGGLNWIQQQLPSGGFGMYFVNLNTGYTVGGFGQIFKTTNGGTNWYVQSSGTTKILRSVYFGSLNTGWIVGDSGLILYTTNGGGPIGIEPISKEIPKEFKLYQNYPNPFNPNTVIKFQIPGYRLVNLAIYDALGKFVSVLVNIELQPGTYEIEFNGSNLASGLYFYRIQAGDYTETKRMILIK